MSVRNRMVVAVVTVVTGLSAVIVGVVVARSSSCGAGVALRIAATPEIAPALRAIGDDWLADAPRVAGQCVHLSVEPVPAATVASRLSVYAGSAVDVAAVPEPSPSEESLPAVWVPDSTAWLARVRAVDQAAFEADAPSIASSPVVIAMPPELAAQLGGSLAVTALRGLLGPGGAVKLGIAEPRRESASLAVTMVVGEALATTDAELPSLVRTLRGVVKAASTAELLAGLGTTVTAVPASEQSVLAAGVAAVPLEPAAPGLDYPYAVRSGVPHEVAQAAEQFRARMLSAGLPHLARAGLRTPEGVAGAGFPTAVGAALPASAAVTALTDAARVGRTLGLWTAANSPTRSLALLDVTSSMGAYQPTTTGGGSRAAVMTAAATGGLDLFAANSKLGLWTFATGHTELLPISELTPERRSSIDAALGGVDLAGTDQAELYDNLLAAYSAMLDGYDPTRPNLIVVLTDGGDRDGSTVRAERFSQELQRLADPTRPIRVVLIGIGAGLAAAANLQRIAETVGGGYFPLTSPEQIQMIFLKALLQVGV